jgi:flagellar M-ring protein FliF
MAGSETNAVAGANRQVILIGLTALLGALLLFALWYIFLRTPYLPAFTNIKSNDAVTITAELDRLKTSYELADDGTTILVPENKVDAARIAILGGDLPLKGAVGFELFNKTDMGLTEFAQKINYQRALQGELARTIMALDEVESARVHLSLPESGIFDHDLRDAKASVTIATKLEIALEPTVVRGVQQLVASAVPDLQPANVAILDARGQLVSELAVTMPAGTLAQQKQVELERLYADKVRETARSAGLAMPMTVAVTAFPSIVSPSQSDVADMTSESPRTEPLRVLLTLGVEPSAGVRDRIFAAAQQAIGFDQTLGDVIEIRIDRGLGRPVAVPIPMPRALAPDAPEAKPQFPNIPVWFLAAAVGVIFLLVLAVRFRRTAKKMTVEERDDFSAKLKSLLANDLANAQP